MMVTEFDLANIVACASSLSERLSKSLLNVDTTQVNEQKESSERLDHWCQVVAQGNWEKFQKRLYWDGLDLDTVRLAMSLPPSAENQILSNWAVTLQEIIQTASEWKFKTEKFQSLIPIDSEKPLPFEDLLLPAIYVARKKLLTCLSSGSLSVSYLPLEILEAKAYLKLEHSLLSELVNLCKKTLELEFSRFRPSQYSFLNLLVTDIKLTLHKTHYETFVQKLLQDGLLTFFQKYPVLAKLIATQIDFWVEATIEFLQYLKADLAEIQQIFQPEGGSSVLGKVIAITPNLSDPHKRGRCVIALTFESGLKLVYKPKDLGLEVAYNQFLDWCNQHFAFSQESCQNLIQNSHPLFKTFKVLNRQTYGFSEYVEQLPCEDIAAAQRFYQRSGMLLCLLYVLGGTDCHSENLIANGEHPVLVDMETLMHHESTEMEDALEQQQEVVVKRAFWDSVLRTGLLPRWDFNKDNRIAYDISGLGSAGADSISPWTVRQCKYVNTDYMQWVHETVAMQPDKNSPILNGLPLSPNDYLEELVDGFEQMYRFLLGYRQALLVDAPSLNLPDLEEVGKTRNQSNPLAALQAQQVRFVFRDTKVYSVILQKTLAPEFLQNGVERSIQLDILARAFLITVNKPQAWPILHSELRAMEQLDVPYFGASSDSDALTVGLEQPIEGYFTAPSYCQVISRLKKLDETDLARQVAIIQASFYARVARTHETEQVGALSASKAADYSTKTSLTREKLFASASALAEKISSQAIREADGSVYWIGLGYIPKAERLQLQTLEENLYDGNCGIALFLATLDHLNDSCQFRELALGALQSIRKVLQTADAQLTQRLAKKIGIGGATGLGSIIYSLVTISHFLQEPALKEDALRVADLITPELIAIDQELDALSGSAGAILGLLSLYHQTAQQAVLDKAIACGQHLLAHRISIDGSPRAWKNFEHIPLTGFSHGAAGIAYALLRLYSVTREPAYKEAALEGISYERSVFSTSAGNWPDFRSFANQNQNGLPTFNVSWCHGAAGIGLGRLGSLSILEMDEIYQDVEVALQTTQKYSLQGIDHLCCGNFGRIEVLLLAAQKLSRPELQEMALQRAAWVVARAEHRGGYQLFPNLPSHIFSPSFFTGTAGIGYGLLRLAYPEVLPSVLLWE
ncbi:MAG: type 2 lantipeptide synthetase LanM family protein [Brasilonema angustatum HA4187-MV1]|jgi:type 2 lantibiotic biosynthesis protein LanM|nr:type 2 lantipeptide synthetase LanM family protein [Brasilonema angustatum HA4187-MV1]